jgi:two-component system, cell cycle sensor histidine kinase and response regulator CckA
LSSRVLLVEDDDSVRMLMRSLLEHDGWRVLVAHDVDQALAVSALAGEIRLLVTDVHLGDSSGPALHRLLLQSHPDAKALYLSRDSRESLIERGLLDRACEFLQKPFTPLDLSRGVRAAAGVE